MTLAACSFDPSGVPVGNPPGGDSGPVSEAGLPDARPPDAALPDAAPPDAELPDAEPPDAGPPCATDTDYVANPDTGQRYWIYDFAVSWTTGRDRCEDDGAHLVVIDDETENAYVRLLGLGNLWIGLNDRVDEDMFVWVTGAELSYENWSDDEPNNSGGEDCVEMQSDGEWNDEACDDVFRYRRFVCECETGTTGQ